MSKQAFANAEEAQASADYPKAITEYRKVIEADTENYENANEKAEACVEQYSSNLISYSYEDFEKNNHSIDRPLVKFSDEASMLCKYLETIISNKVINSPEVTLFDNNASTIVSGLFKAYYNNPRLLHKGTQRRIYIDTRKITQNVIDFEYGNHDIIREEIELITKTDLNTLDDAKKEEYKGKRKILVRNICDFIAGMTDTYALNEFRKIEKQL